MILQHCKKFNKSEDIFFKALIKNFLLSCCPWDSSRRAEQNRRDGAARHPLRDLRHIWIANGTKRFFFIKNGNRLDKRKPLFCGGEGGAQNKSLK